jgi:hypothetical protein
MIKAREKVPMSDVAVVLSKHEISNSLQDWVRVVERLIASGAVDGVIEGDAYVSRLAKQREILTYQS